MNVLDEICAIKREHIAQRKAAVSESELRKRIQGTPRGFKQALENKIKQNQFGLIAEIKKASPSGGLIRADFDPATLAKAYEQGGAACISVLTDAPYFQGHDEYLMQARDAVTLPVLRKDFMLDMYQIVESRALGADCVLLIMAVLDDAQAKALQAVANELNMDVLVEVHDERELQRALALKPAMIGINNRNLKTLKVDLSTSETLAKRVPGNILTVCESGLRVHADLQRMKKAGISCFLVGESLMREKNVAQATESLLKG